MSIKTPSHAFDPALEATARVSVLRSRLPRGGVRAAVVGAGRSGLAAVELLSAVGSKVKLLDDRDPAVVAADPRLVAAGVDVELGRLTAEALEDAELVVLSPGVPRAREELRASILRGILVGEIELASWFVRAPLVGITGTNGKSTTTALTAHLFETAGWRTFAGGNLGEPLASLALALQRDPDRVVDVAVVELSSYQLESIVDATFEVGCWLNLTPDHTDRYADLVTYAAAKRRIVQRRSINGVAVLNANDRWCSEIGARVGGPIRWFSAESGAFGAAARAAHVLAREPEGTSLIGPDTAVRRTGEGEERYELANPALPGMHNRENMCAAIECARHFALPIEKVQAGLSTFKGLPHRIELVGEVRGARYYNDSKATNVDSAVIALRALSGPKVLIAGGKDKGAPWAPLVAEAEVSGVKVVLAIGAATPIVEASFRGSAVPVEATGTLERAIARAMELAGPGEVVLLSPACASFDQFRNYEHRGDEFRARVRAMGGG